MKRRGLLIAVALLALLAAPVDDARGQKRGGTLVMLVQP